MPYDQEADLRQQRITEEWARAQEAKEARRIAMQRSPRMKPETQRLSALRRIPLLNTLLSWLSILFFRREEFRLVRRGQHPVGRLPHIPRAGVPKEVMVGRFGRRRFPGWPGKMARGLRHKRPR